MTQVIATGFTDQQNAALRAPLDRARVQSRTGSNGAKVDFLDHWTIEEMANQIFGFDGWDCETIHLEPVHEPQMVVTERQAEHYRGFGIALNVVPESNDGKTNKPQVVACWRATVRVSVHAGGRQIVRTRNGAARSFQPTLGEAVENAIKAAETDAMKRALSSFGSQFGLALYDKEKRNVVDMPRDRRPALESGFGDQRPTGHRETISQRASPSRAANPRAISETEREIHHVQRGIPV